MLDFLSAFGPALKDQHWSIATVAILVALATGLLWVTGQLEIHSLCIYLVFGAAYTLLVLSIIVFVVLLISAGFRATKVNR